MAGLAIGAFETAILTRSFGWRLIGESMVPDRRGVPHTSAKYSRLTVRACQLAHQVGLGFQGLADHHQAAGVLVEAVHDAGARHRHQLRAVVQQAVQQRARPVAGTPDARPGRPAC
jgi:hypothetical protein